MKFRSSVLLGLFLVFLSLQSYATHIVGGVINYRSLGGTRYQVTMRVYRDCNSATTFDGQPGSSVTSAVVGLYDELTGNLIQSIDLTSPVVTRILPVITNPCMTTTSVCVEEGVYTATINVPDGTRSYQLIYCRCCRNGTINNISTPGSVGASYIARIPPSNTYHNSNPVYNAFPPIFICQNAPLVFNHSAADPDGDSLYYELCNSYDGSPTGTGSPTVGATAPASFPGLFSVTYVAPYSASDPLGSSPPPAVAMSIDPNTGILTGTPPTIGQFVMGVCCHEFRGGVELSTTFRDFQFNVVSCPIPVSSIPSTNINPTTGIGDFIVNCDNFNVTFINRSSGAVAYHWDFGIAGRTTDTSNVTNPTFTYPDTGVYLVTLVAMNALGCIDTAKAYVKIYPLFVPDFSFTNRCLDTAMVFFDRSTSPYSNPISWTWTFGDGGISAFQNPTHRYATAGSYNVTLRVRTDKGCDKSVSHVVRVFPLPVPGFTVDSTCVNTPVAFRNTSTGAVSYQWNFGDGGTSSAFSPNHTYTSAGSYTVVLLATSDSGCTQRASRVITVNPLPVITTNNDTTICPGSRVQMFATGGTSYLWTPATGLSGTTISNPLATPTVNTIYRVSVADANRCQNHDSVIVNMYRNFPAFDFTNECKDTAVQFTDRSTSTGGAIVAWSWNFGDLSTSAVQNPSHLYATPGTYQVKLIITTALGCRDSITQTVIIRPLPVPDFTTDSTCINAPVAFINGSSGAPIVATTWNFGDGSPTVNTLNPNHTFTSAATFNVQLRVTSDSGCTQFITKPVVVHPRPFISTSNDTSLCPGFSAPIWASGGVRYFWSPGQYLSDSLISNPIATAPNVRTVFNVIVADANRCQSKDSVVLNFFVLPLIDAGPDTSVCLAPGSFRDSAQLHASGGVSYRWTPTATLNNPNISNPWASPDTNTYYYVLVTDANGCVQRDSARVVVLDPQLDIIATKDTGLCIYDTITINAADQGLITVYRWSPSIGLSDPNTRLPLFFPRDTTTYFITVENYCYRKSDTVKVNVYPLPSISTGGVDSICVGDTLQINAHGANVWVWTPDPTLWPWNTSNPRAFPTFTNTYYVTATDTLGCSNSDSLKLLVYLFPNANILPPPRIICFGSPVQLQATGGVRYLWSYGFTMNDSTIADPLVTPPDTLTYWVKVTNEHNCSLYDSVVLNVQMPVTAIAEPDSEICRGNVLRLNARGGLYYRWSPSLYLTNASTSNPFTKPDSTITYFVNVANDCFNDDTSLTIIVHQLPPADAGPDTTIFRNTSTVLHGSGGVTYAWYPNYGLNDPGEPITIASPLKTTQYVLFVTDDYGCVNYDTVMVYVVANTVILIPSGFSPNGDGVNDIFHIVKWLNLDKVIEFSVWNRWGEKIWETSDKEAGWDGTFKGREQPIGTYVWYLKGVDYDGNTLTRSGNVTLVR